MIPIGALFSKIKIFESCTCGGAQQVVKSRVNEPPSCIGSNVKRLKNKYIYA